MNWEAFDVPPTRLEHHFGRVVRCFVERPESLNAMFAASLARFPERDALVAGDARLNYRQLAARAAAVAANLATAGITQGDRVAVLLGNSVEFVETMLGVLRLGAIVVPLNIREQRPELTFILNQCAAKAIVFESALADRLPDAYDAPTLALRYAVGETVHEAREYGELRRPAASLPAATVGEHDTAVILYTSGTTGRPKGAMLTHFNVVHSALHFRVCMRLTEADRSLLAVPATHVTGLVAILWSMLAVGGCALLMREFRSKDFLALAAAERMTHTLVVPAIYNLLLRDAEFGRSDLSAWRLGGFGGAPMPEGTIRMLARELPGLTLANAYGATETTSPTTVMPLGLQAANLDSVGIVVPCGDVRVMDDSGRELPHGEEGELWIAGPMVVPGYWDNPEATAREFAGGYWKSGDLGSVDADGFVRILDRKKDMVNRGGYKIFSAEVESVLSLHPAVVESAIVARPDPVLGEKVEAFVVLREPGTTADELRAHCARQLADYKVPDFVTFRNEPLPRNANGKVLKRALREGGS